MDLDRGGRAMESLTDHREPSNSQAAAAAADSSACPRLVLLPPYAKRADDFSAVADAKTTSAASCTSTGRRFRIYFGIVPSPGISSFIYCWEDRQAYDNDRRVQCPLVLAAHGDCILLEVTTPYNTLSSLSPRPPPNHFVYQAPAAGRPPSLLLLPSCYIPRYYNRRGGAYPPELQAEARNMIHGETALLRRGEDNILVAVLEVDRQEQEAVELCLLRSGRDREWLLKRVPIIVYDDDNGSRDDCQGNDDPLRRWRAGASFAVGDRFLCWVDYKCGILFIDMAADELSLKFRYVPLPGEGGGSNLGWNRNLAPAGNGSVRFVEVDSTPCSTRCCCGEPSSSTSCERGQYLFIVTTWTMKLSMDEPMEWVKDGVLDCNELWAQPGYTGLPRVTVEYPVVVNSDDPDAVCFVVRTDYFCYSMDKNRKAYTIEVDTRTKVLRSVVPYNGSDGHPTSYFPAKIQYT